MGRRTFVAIRSGAGCVCLREGVEDRWRWMRDTLGAYSFKSTYQLLNSSSPMMMDDFFKLVWNKDVPLKVPAFGWRLALSRFPAKDNLVLINILQ